jgi:hypothetical protein
MKPCDAITRQAGLKRSGNPALADEKLGFRYAATQPTRAFLRLESEIPLLKRQRDLAAQNINVTDSFIVE